MSVPPLVQEKHAEEQMQAHIDQVTLELLNTYESLASIFDSSTRLSATRSIEEAARNTLDCAIDIAESSGGVMVMFFDDNPTVLAAANTTDEVVDHTVYMAGTDLGEGKYEDQVQRALTAADGRFVKSALWVPLQKGDRHDGIIVLFSTGDKTYSSVDLKVVRILAGQGALAVRNLKYLDELELKNRSLSVALEDLTAAQDDLVRAERFSTLGEMASMIVHDIKNPMGGLLGYAQLLEATADNLTPDNIREYSGLIIQEMRRLSSLTEEIMDFSRGVDSKLHIREMIPIDLLNTAWPVLQGDFSSNGMTLLRGEIASNSKVMVDSDKLERVFINLAVNARQAMEPGGTLEVSLREAGSWVEFSFRDTGKGIPEEMRNQIFEPFVTRKKGHSLGIGLAMCQWIAQAHKGEIRVAESGPEGTDMVVRLPAVKET